MKILKGSEGIALFVAILMMTIMLCFIGASLFLSRVDTKITNNYKFAIQALEVADAGLQHALAVIEQGFDFDNELNCGTPPCDVISTTTFSAAPWMTYSVTVENDAFDIANGGSPTDDTDSLVVLISTANGPNDTKRQVQAYVNRSPLAFTPPGALYLPASSANVSFDAGTGFFITGDDTGYDGSPATNPKPSITGVAPILDNNGNDPVGDSFKNALGSSRYDLVQGKGYSSDPLTPSVFTTTNQIDVNQIALNFYNHPSTVKYLSGLSKYCSSNKPCTLGTDASPQITYIRESGSKYTELMGYFSGSGVLVTEGKTHLFGEFNFHGLVIAIKLGLTGGTVPGTISADYFFMNDNAKIFWGVFIGPTNDSQAFQMRKNTKIKYSSAGITLANSLCSSCFPQPARVSAWLDK